MRKIDQFVGREMSSDRELERKEHAKQVGKEVKEEQEGEWKVGWRDTDREWELKEKNSYEWKWSKGHTFFT